MGAPVGGTEEAIVRMTDAELEEEQRSCESLIEKYGDPEDYPWSRRLVRRSQEQLRFVVEARNARAEARRLGADRNGLLGSVKQFLADESQDGTAGESLFVQRLDVTVRLIEARGPRPASWWRRFIEERSERCG